MHLPRALWSGLVALAFLPGCPPPSSSPAGDGECFVDQECGEGELCARDELCWPADEIRAVKAMWTVRGEPATATTCASHPELYIRFDGQSVPDHLQFAPVPCEAGQFSVDKLPRAFRFVELGIKGSGFWDRGSFDATGTAMIDLRFF